MAIKIKERYITRTIKRYSVKTLNLNLTDNQVFTSTIYAPIGVPESDLLIYLKEHFDTKEIVIAAIQEVTVDESLYRISESSFIALGERVDKPETEEEEEA